MRGTVQSGWNTGPTHKAAGIQIALSLSLSTSDPYARANLRNFFYAISKEKTAFCFLDRGGFFGVSIFFTQPKGGASHEKTGHACHTREVRGVP